MKLSLLALATLLSGAVAFAPAPASRSPTALHGASGHDVRAGSGFWTAAGHIQTIGGGRGAPDAGRSVVDGDEVRDERSCYAPFGGRGSALGEIGYDGSPRRAYVPASGGYRMPKVSVMSGTSTEFTPPHGGGGGHSDVPAFVPHSSTGAGGHSPAAPSGARPASFGLGSWKK